MVIKVAYLMEPLCGWCYGASPALHALGAEPGVEITIAPTGMFAGDGGRPMSAEFAAFAWGNDQRIEGLTGQRFTERYQSQLLGDTSKRFDSGPATLALTAVMLTAPDRELGALIAFQETRYVDGRDTADGAVLAEVLRELKLDAATQRLLEADDALVGANRKRMSSARRDMATFGAQGVSNLIASDGATRRLVAGGVLYGDLTPLVGHLRSALVAS
jgi:putative protein-disulfide isomerase